MKHTQGKWKCWLNKKAGYTLGCGKEILGMIFPPEVKKDTLNISQAEANAEYICLAVNFHANLVTALHCAASAFRDKGYKIHADGIDKLLNELK